ncbi:hypothetical protein V6N13_089406 [Hibiscus sabdariffa]|uniref:Reverse transcriptase zinc-binding domain-containing protein n=1 Tax=Hibiscus sabdariffa TaxID=183260 RepID=A0ABR2NSR9_9ROSI
MTNFEHTRRHFADKARCNLCDVEVEDFSNVLRTCPHTFCVWRELINVEKIHDFMTCDIKTWIWLNLTQPNTFAKEPMAWDLMFGGTCWFICLNRNAVIFTDGIEEGRRPTLEHAFEWLKNVVIIASLVSIPLRRTIEIQH